MHQVFCRRRGESHENLSRSTQRNGYEGKKCNKNIGQQNCSYRQNGLIYCTIYTVSDEIDCGRLGRAIVLYTFGCKLIVGLVFISFCYCFRVIS